MDQSYHIYTWQNWIGLSRLDKVPIAHSRLTARLLLGQNVIHSCRGIYDISRQVMFEYMQIRVIRPDQAMCEVEGRSNERALADNWC